MKLWGRKDKGITLLIAIILTTAFTAITAAMTTFVYKQNILSQAGKNSALALFAADSGLECMIYNDLVENKFFPETYKASPADISLNCHKGDRTDIELEYINAADLSGYCDGYNGGAGTHDCFSNKIEVAPNGLESQLTFYVRSDGTNNWVRIRSRGTNGSGVRPVERALEYSYCFRIDGNDCS